MHVDLIYDNGSLNRPYLPSCNFKFSHCARQLQEVLSIFMLSVYAMSFQQGRDC